MLREIESTGVDRDTARAAADEVLSGLDEATFAARALARRLRGPQPHIVDQAQFRRLYAYLLRQGFTPATALAVLKAHARRAAVPDPIE